MTQCGVLGTTTPVGRGESTEREKGEREERALELNFLGGKIKVGRI